MSSDRPYRVPRVLRESGAWSLVALGVAYFSRILFLGESLYLRDLYLLFLPQKALVADIWRSGVLPLWNPNLHGGMPLLADISNSALYPSNLLYLLMPTVQALNVDIVLHTIAASIAAYALARTLGLGQGASFVAGVGFAYCGFALSLTNLLVVHLARPYWPLMLLCWHRYLRHPHRERPVGHGGRHRWWIATVLLGGLQVLAGGPEMIAITHVSLGLWTLAWIVARRARLSAVGAWLAQVAAVLALGAVQLLPMVGLLGDGARGAGFDYQAWSRWSLPLLRLPELVIPGFFGPVDTYAAADYWGQTIVDFGYPYILSVYFGVPLLVLAAIGLAKSEILARPLILLLAALTGLSVMLAVGRSWPFFELLFDTLPPVRLFRFPIKALGMATLPVALLAGLGYDRLARARLGTAAPSTRSATRRACWMLGATGLLAALASLTLRLGWSPAITLIGQVFGRADDTVRLGLSSASGHAALFAALTGILLIASARRASAASRQALGLLALVLALDLMIAGRRVNPAAPARLLTTPPAALAAVRAAAGDGRLYRTADPQVAIPVPTNEAIWRYRHNIEGLALYLGAAFGQPVIFHVDFHGLAPRRVMRLAKVIAGLPWDRRLGLLSAAGVGAVITREAPDVPGLEHRQAFVAGGHRLALYRNTNLAPRAQLIALWQPARDDDHALRALSHPAFDPRRHAVIDAPGSSLPDVSCIDPGQTLATRTWRDQERAFESRSDCDRYLVLQHGFDPGWRVWIDGEAAQPERANYAFSAVFLPAGEHDVVWRYRPAAVRRGLSISAVALVLLVSAALVPGRGRGSKSHHSPSDATSRKDSPASTV